MKFQKRIKILPGVTVNLSNRGASTSFGVKGARVTLGHGKTRTTVGLPGTGLSHTTVQTHQNKAPPSPLHPPQNTTTHQRRTAYLIVFLLFVFFAFLTWSSR